jgi:apolipoprotein N-acyltransferase
MEGFRALCGLEPKVSPTNADNPGTAVGWLIGQASAVVLLLGGTVAYGFFRLGQAEFRPGPIVALLQSSIDQRIRNLGPAEQGGEAEKARRGMLQEYGLLVYCAKSQSPRPHLIVWPETSYPETWFDISPKLDLHDVDPQWAQIQRFTHMRFQKMVIERSGISNLIGVQARILEHAGQKPTKYNSAILLQGDGAYDGRYDKIHRVPFGEYVPLQDWLPFMAYFAPSEYEEDFSIRAGTKFTRFPLGKHRFGVIICYEDSDPCLARQYGRDHADGPPVDFLLNISNDGWFDGTSEHEEHFALCRFRAVEARRAVARAVNMGISGVIDGNGRVQAPEFMGRYEGISIWAINGTKDGWTPTLAVSDWKYFKKTPGVLTAIIPIDSRTSFYALWGDWLPIGCWCGLGLALAWALVRSRQRPAELRL